MKTIVKNKENTLVEQMKSLLKSIQDSEEKLEKKNIEKKKERSLGLDIIRTIAIFCVFTVHAIAYKGILDAEQLSLKWTFFVAIRFFAMISVPLFLLLTGYLNNKKEISKKYYKGIVPLIVSYLVISIAEIIATAAFNQTPIDIKKSIISIFNFTANGYAWYFEMYIGLFLLIPFLNILYENIPKQKDKFVLIGSLAFLTFIPTIVKSFKAADTWLNITPDYWQIIYPITYFYIGKLINELKPKLKMLYRILLVILSTAIPCVFCYLFSTETQYAWFMFNGFEALTTALIAVSVFLLFYDFKWKIPVLGKVITDISICSFEMYLFSSIWDKYLYSTYSYNMFFMIAMVAVCTYISAKLWLLFRNYVLKIK